jgi:hypothetical protein
MAPTQPVEDETPGATDRLIQLLRQADASIGHLRERTLTVAALEDPVSLGFCPRQMASLRGILDHGRGRIQRRLAVFKAPGTPGDEPAPESSAPGDIADPAAFMAEYRTCCHILCRSLNEALRISHAPASALLSDFVLRLEKQLWLMDVPKHDPEADRYRSASLFLTC